MNETRHYRNFRGNPTNRDDVTAPADRTLFSNPINHLRSQGSLTYLEFIRLVKHLWEDAHPDIPILPTQGGKLANYPVIVYGIEMRQTHTSDPKLRKRETITHNGDQYVVMGQRFNNVVSFTVVTEVNPGLAEEIIEVFEAFMMEYTPIFKEMGVSEIVYARRLPDAEQNRQGQDINTRAVTYLVTLEKVFATSEDRLEQVAIDARVFLESIRNDEELPAWWAHGAMKNLAGNYSSEPRYALGFVPKFEINEDNLEDDSITIPETRFQMGDLIYLYNTEGNSPLQNGYYVILHHVGDSTYDLTLPSWKDGVMEYTRDPIIYPQDSSTGGGIALHANDTYISARIVDQGVDNPDWHSNEPDSQD